MKIGEYSVFHKTGRQEVYTRVNMVQRIFVTWRCGMRLFSRKSQKKKLTEKTNK